MPPDARLTADMRFTLSQMNAGYELRLSELGGGEAWMALNNSVRRLDWQTFGQLLALGFIAPTTRRANRYVMTEAGRTALGEPPS